LLVIYFDKTQLEKSKHNTNDPLNITKDSINALVGKNVPFNKWNTWGLPETLEGTDGKYWIVYLDSANVSFVSDKNTDKILFIDFDKKSALINTQFKINSCFVYAKRCSNLKGLLHSLLYASVCSCSCSVKYLH
jgi:hypothetical protein